MQTSGKHTLWIGRVEPATPVPAWLDLGSSEPVPGNVIFTDSLYNYEAEVRANGCIDLTQYSNSPGNIPDRDDELDDYIHICDLDDFIARLTALRQEIRRHFGADHE